MTKREIKMNSDLYVTDEWGFEDRMGEVRKYQALQEKDGLMIGGITFVIGLITCGLMALLNKEWDFVDMFIDMCTWAIAGSALFIMGGYTVLARYKGTLKEENHKNV